MARKSNKLNYVGQRLPLRSSEAKVRGDALYAGDLEFPDMLEGAILRSRHPHAKVLSIDVSQASALPGVKAVITGGQLPTIKYMHLPRFSDRFVLARDKVRFYGEGIAAVAATSREVAMQALELIDVQYQELPYAEDPGKALRKRFPEINSGPGGSFEKNMALRFDRNFGDVADGTERAAFIVEGTYRNGMTAPACLETSSTVARFDASTGDLHLWTSTLTPSIVCAEVAEVLHLDRKSVHINPIEVGGGVSGKSHVGEEEAIVACLAMQTGHPVRMSLSRKEEFMTGNTDLGSVMHVRHAIDRDGSILARSSSVTLDMGAYSAFAPAHLIAGRQVTACLYRVQAAHFDCQFAYTNKSPGGHCAGMGVPQLTWAIEDQMDQLAEKLGKDPLEYRIEQSSRSGDVTPLGWEIQSSEMAACLETVATRIGWRQARDGSTPFHGVGVAAMVHPSAGVLYGEGAQSKAMVELCPNGRFKLGTLIAEAGTWHCTTLAQMCAEVLGVDPGLIDVEHLHADISSDAGDLASQELYLASVAVVQAAESLLDKLRNAVATLLGEDEEKIILDGRGIRLHGSRRIPLRLSEVFDRCGSLRSTGSFVSSTPHPDPYTGYGNFSPAHAFGAQAAKVEVDPLTGGVRVLRIIAAQDVGRVVNPSALEARIQEGILQGIGMALMEEFRVERGRPITTAFSDYQVPRFDDVPDIEVVAIESNQSEGPFGLKAVGEGAMNATIAAVGNAIAHATGVRMGELPFAPDRVLAALQRRGALAPVSSVSWTRPRSIRDASARTLYPRVVFPVKEKLFAKFPPVERSIAQYDYLLAKSLNEALEHLLKSQMPVKIRAGGTELQAGINQGIYRPALVVDVSRIKELKHIELTNNCLRIGAGAGFSQVAMHEQVNALFPVLAQVTGAIATPQVRNMATVGGNLCQEKQCWYFRNAFPCHKSQGPGCPCFALAGDNRQHSIMGSGPCPSPCPSDLAPVLDVLDAELVIGSAASERRTNVQSFYRGPGEPKLDPDEMLLAIELPLSSSSRKSAFEKFSPQQTHYAEASVAVSLRLFRGLITRARISLGSVSPLPERAHIAERMLVNREPTDALIHEAALATVRGAMPMSRNGHKVDLVVGLAEKALSRVVSLR